VSQRHSVTGGFGMKHLSVIIGDSDVTAAVEALQVYGKVLVEDVDLPSVSNLTHCNRIGYTSAASSHCGSAPCACGSEAPCAAASVEPPPYQPCTRRGATRWLLALPCSRCGDDALMRGCMLADSLALLHLPLEAPCAAPPAASVTTARPGPQDDAPEAEVISVDQTTEYCAGWRELAEGYRPVTCSRCGAADGSIRDGRVVQLRRFEAPGGHKPLELCYFCFERGV
jgi:hypothetical protein